jgi:hypothetical protein
MRLLFCILLCGCAPGSYVPPLSVSAGFFGAEVTVAEPGFTVPAKVVTSAAVSIPTLMVPATEPVAAIGSVPVTNTAGQTTTVPVVTAPVISPVLAVPPVKP